MQLTKGYQMITLQQAIELASKAHEGQWRNPSTVTSYVHGISINLKPNSLIRTATK